MLKKNALRASLLRQGRSGTVQEGKGELFFYCETSDK